ncbi:GIY-YIG nuclease family protein [Herpetosiphon gulosus]
MWLEYGISDELGLIHISDTPRGHTDLHCPYCHGRLVAKKGPTVAHHFAHNGTTCNPASRTTDLPLLPFFHSFTLHVAPRLLAQLQAFNAGHTYDADWLKAANLIRYNGFTFAHELTKLGQIPLGLLSVNLFSAIHEERLAAQHDRLDQRLASAWRAGNAVALAEAETDLMLYRTQWQRVLRSALYLVEIETRNGRFHKVGITMRPIAERIAEIQAALLPHVGTMTMKVLNVFPHRGHVEPYVKFKYAKQRRAIGNFTEYFDWLDRTGTIRDLRRMPAKVLTSLEQGVLDGMPSPTMQAIFQAHQEQEAAAQRAARAAARGARTKAGMDAARQAGVHVGRPNGSGESAAAVLAKPWSRAILQCLADGMSLRETAAMVGVALNTVRKVKAAAEQVATTTHDG